MMLASWVQSIKTKADEVKTAVSSLRTGKTGDFEKTWLPVVSNISTPENAIEVAEQWLQKLAKADQQPANIVIEKTVKQLVEDIVKKGLDVPFLESPSVAASALEQPVVLTFREAILKDSLLEPFLYSIANLSFSARKRIYEHKSSMAQHRKLTSFGSGVVEVNVEQQKISSKPADSIKNPPDTIIAPDATTISIPAGGGSDSHHQDQQREHNSSLDLTLSEVAVVAHEKGGSVSVQLDNLITQLVQLLSSSEIIAHSGSSLHISEIVQCLLLSPGSRVVTEDEEFGAGLNSGPVLCLLGYLRLVQEDWRISFLKRVSASWSASIKPLNDTIFEAKIPPLPIPDESLVLKNNPANSANLKLPEGIAEPPDLYIFYDILMEKQRRRCICVQEAVNFHTLILAAQESIDLLGKQRLKQSSTVCEGLISELVNVLTKSAELGDALGEEIDSLEKEEKAGSSPRQTESKKKIEVLKNQQVELTEKRKDVEKRREGLLRQLEETEALIAELKCQEQNIEDLVSAVLIGNLSAGNSFEISLRRKQNTKMSLDNIKSESESVQNIVRSAIDNQLLVVVSTSNLVMDLTKDHHHLGSLTQAYTERLQALVAYIEFLISASTTENQAKQGLVSDTAARVSFQAALARALRQVDSNMAEAETIYEALQPFRERDSETSKEIDRQRQSLRQLTTACRLAALSNRAVIKKNTQNETSTATS